MDRRPVLSRLTCRPRPCQARQDILAQDLAEAIDSQVELAEQLRCSREDNEKLLAERQAVRLMVALGWVRSGGVVFTRSLCLVLPPAGGGEGEPGSGGAAAGPGLQHAAAEELSGPGPDEGTAGRARPGNVPRTAPWNQEPGPPAPERLHVEVKTEQSQGAEPSRRTCPETRPRP